MIKLEVGKFYRTRDGRTVGPIKQDGGEYFRIDHPFDWPDDVPYGECWCDDGEYSGQSFDEYPCDLVEEYVPVTKIQTSKIVPLQTINGLVMRHHHAETANVELVKSDYTTKEIRAHAARLIELADIMDEA